VFYFSPRRIIAAGGRNEVTHRIKMLGATVRKVLELLAESSGGQ